MSTAYTNDYATGIASILAEDFEDAANGFNDRWGFLGWHADVNLSTLEFYVNRDSGAQHVLEGVDELEWFEGQIDAGMFEEATA